MQVMQVVRDMAKKQNPTIKKLDLLEDQLTCPVCLDSFKDPRTLPCLHSFCAGCLERLPQVEIAQTGAHGLNCPSCRTKADLPKQGVRGYPKAFHLNNILEAVQTIVQQEDDESVEPEQALMCGNCLKNEAEVYCVECDKMICQLCNDVHKRWTAMANHKVVSIEESLSKINQQKQPEKPEPVSELKCPTHDKPLDLYCVTCEEPICYHCTIKSHKGHAHDLVVDAYEESKTIMKERIRKLVKNIKETEKKQTGIRQSKKEIHKKGEKCKASVNELCDEFIQKIEKVRTLGLQCVNDGVSAYVQFEDQRLKIVDTELSAQNGCKEVAETTLENSTPPQLLAIKKDVIAGIDRLLPTPKPHHPIVPCRSVDMPPTLISDFYAMPDKKPNKKSQEIPHKLAPTGDLYALPTKRVPRDLYAQPTQEIPDLYALPTKRVLTQTQSSQPLHDVSKRTTSSAPPVPSRSVQDQAVVNLRENIFATVNFDYPEEALKQFKCVIDIPDKILIGKVSTGTFVLSYMGRSVVVDKDKITCSFESTTNSGDIDCESDYFTKDDVVKYQIVFTTPELKKDGDFRFILKIGSFVFSTNKHLNVVLDNDAVQSTFVERSLPLKPLDMTLYCTIDHS